jgi:acyl carrier protein
MAFEKQEIENLLLSILSSINDLNNEDEKIEFNSDSVLFGENPQIDSLTLVSLVVDLESAISENYDVNISLTDDRAMTREISPFLTVATLRDYIEELLTEKLVK